MVPWGWFLSKILIFVVYSLIALFFSPNDVPSSHSAIDAKKFFFAYDEIYKFEFYTWLFEFCTWLFEFCTWIFDCFPENSHIIEKLPWILNCFTKIHIKNTIFSVSWRTLTRARFFCTWVKWFCMWWHHSHSGFFCNYDYESYTASLIWTSMEF